MQLILIVATLLIKYILVLMKNVNCLKDFKAASWCRSDSSGAAPGKAAQTDSIIVLKYWCAGPASKGEGVVQSLTRVG